MLHMLILKKKLQKHLVRIPGNSKHYHVASKRIAWRFILSRMWNKQRGSLWCFNSLNRKGF
jgi:hypothetical protein